MYWSYAQATQMIFTELHYAYPCTYMTNNCHVHTWTCIVLVDNIHVSYIHVHDCTCTQVRQFSRMSDEGGSRPNKSASVDVLAGRVCIQ